MISPDHMMCHCITGQGYLITMIDVPLNFHRFGRDNWFSHKKKRHQENIKNVEGLMSRLTMNGHY